ncbi:MAG: CpsD/CapB family tyrosine-protein kinase [Gammaproteobacteria bacterium]
MSTEASAHEKGEVAEVTEIAGSPAVFRTPSIEVDAVALERERILPCGAGGPYGGAYKLLRTQALKRLDQLSANSLAVVSPCSADGKTLTAINLAIAIAATTGRTALLVDFDLRNPNVHRRFGFEPSVGVEDCLETRRPIHEALVKVTGYERLTLLPARSRVEQSSELLSATRVGEVIAEMRNRYANRVLIFDLPPVLQADDALAFSQHMQAALLVVSERLTKREDVTRTLELLRDTPVIGTVLNQSRSQEARYY